MNITLGDSKLNMYMGQMQTQKIHHTHRESRNSSLPSINFNNQEKLKVNVLQRNIQQSTNQIIARRARNKALLREIQKIQTKRDNTLKQIQHIRTTKERINQDQAFKKQLKKRKQALQQELKAQVDNMRQTIKCGTTNAKQMLKDQNKEKGIFIRLLQQEGEEYLQNLKRKEIEKKKQKITEVKISLEEGNRKKAYFQNSRLSFAKQNYLSRVDMSVHKKKKLNKTLNTLEQKQQNLVQEVKKIHKQYTESLKQLSTLNPEQKSKPKIINYSPY